MASPITPLILGPDGVLSTSLQFSTTISSRFFTGTVDASAVDMEVSIRGGAYTRDPDYMVFDGTSWMVPNAGAFPDGLDLDAGSNVILIRAVTAVGGVSTPATINIHLVQPSDVQFVALPLTNISVEQKDGSVQITVDAPTDTTFFRGVSFYASLYEGGGATGYTRISVSPVSSGTTVEELSDLGTATLDALVALDGEGNPAADPLLVEYIGQQVSSDGTVLQSDFDQSFNIPETTTALRTSISVSAVRQVTQYSFDHSRTASTTSDPPTIFVGTFAAAPKTDPLYYVVTAVYYDPNLLVEVESSFSAEVVGHPLTVTTIAGTFPVVSRQQIVRNVIEAIFRSNPQIKVEPGSVLRDTFIDPFAAQAEQLRFIVDFLHRAQSFTGLLSVDDPAGTGSSVSVGSSTYKLALKKAFGLTKDSDVQGVIDRAFEALCANYGVFRRPGRFARGEVTFYTTKQPTRTIPITLGATVSGGSISFRVSSAKTISVDNIGRIFDPISGRYQVTLPVQATTVGSAGNIAAGQVRKVISGVTGLFVVNASSMFGGDDQETNHDMATRAQNALASVDSGTARGYLQIAADVPGIVQAEVVSAGDSLMMRDMDSLGVHRGGKVDVWAQGENIATVTDSFAFERDVARDVHFVVIGNPLNLTFRAIDTTLTIGHPIVEMIDNEGAGFGLRNASTGLWFDLTGVTLVSFDTIQLDTSIAQPPVTLTDVVFGDYRRITGNTFVLTRQPVREIQSVVGEASGTLPTTAFHLVYPDDPLLNGRSGIAGTYVEITPVSDGAGGLIPTGGTVVVTIEAHVLTGLYPEYLDRIGVDPLTVVVSSADGLTTFRGPDDPSGVSDYTVIDGDSITPVAIQRIATGVIVSGDSVRVAYQHAENFTATYTTNVIVRVAQDAVNAKRHATADVIVKEAVEIPVDIAGSVVLTVGSDQSTVDTSIRTNLGNLFASLRLGIPVRQSDIVGVIEGTPGVSYVAVPLTTMIRQAGATVVREALATGATYIAGWSVPTVSVWLIGAALSSATTDGGGPDGDFRGVFQDDVAMILVPSSPGTVLRVSAGRAFIIGVAGASIPALSDDATLITAGYTTPDAIASRRASLTGNRILVSTPVSDAAVNHSYSVTYIVGVSSGVMNIPAGKAEHLVLGNVEFTFTEDQ